MGCCYFAGRSQCRACSSGTARSERTQVMNKFLVASALAGSLFVASCTTVPGVDPITGNPISTEVTNITAAAVAICGFEPTAATVTNILATFIPGASPVAAIVNQVAGSICNAVTAKAVRLGGIAPQVNGVTISGRFVQRGRHGVKHGASVNGVVVDGHFVNQ